MNEAIKIMLNKYQITDLTSFEHAFKEIIQEIALLGLWRAKFFEHAVFYGGTALRIFYGLDRFSEDLDFSLLKPEPNFVLNLYHHAVEQELVSFGFTVTITQKTKNIESAIQSAFIKAETKKHLFEIGLSEKLSIYHDKKRAMKIKFEIDTDPPQNFETEAKYLLQPIEFYVKTFKIQDLFAGKMHAVLCRKWQNRVKGRDWYDMIWFIKNNFSLNLEHLQARMVQTGHWLPTNILTKKKLIDLLVTRIEQIDFEAAKKDIAPFIAEQTRLDIWSKAFFKDIVDRIRT